MAKIFEKHPLPWAVNYRGGGADYMVDANGNSIPTNAEIYSALVQMTEMLPKGKKRRLGAGRSNSKYMVKDTTTGTYRGPQCSATRQFCCQVQARRSASRCNKNANSLSRYVVVEVEVKEKVKL